jgi:hypothetical protein
MEFDASQRHDIVELLARCIAELPPPDGEDSFSLVLSRRPGGNRNSDLLRPD